MHILSTSVQDVLWGGHKTSVRKASERKDVREVPHQPFNQLVPETGQRECVRQTEHIHNIADALLTRLESQEAFHLVMSLFWAQLLYYINSTLNI